MNPQTQQLTRGMRAWLYRRLPVWNQGFFLKKLAGYERRWGLETRGFTKAGFVDLFFEKVIADEPAGLFYELQAGDGLVGSLGLWLEKQNPPWRVEAWEHRKNPAEALSIQRPNTLLHKARKTRGLVEEGKKSPAAITIRGSREAAAACRALREGIFRPCWIGIWNPRRHPVWFFRMKKAGFRLELVYERTEFYRDAEK
jgi:hypothetical protein